MAWPLALAGDKAYRADWIDGYLLDLGIAPVIPSKANELVAILTTSAKAAKSRA